MLNRDFQIEMTKKNIQVAELYFKTDDFQLMNVLGNRLMSDCIFGNTADLAVIGFFVKQMALNYLNLKPRLSPADLLDAKRVGEKCLTSLSSFTDKIDIPALWNAYHDFNIEIQRYSSSDVDEQVKAIYGDNPKMTEHVRKWLAKFLSDNRDILFHPENNFLKTLLSELQRTGLAYGYSVNDTVVFSCVVALDRYYDYFRIQYQDTEGQLDEDAVKSIVFPYIDAIAKLASSNQPDYHIVTQLLWQLIKAWRESFLYFSELPRRSTERPIQLPEESKKKLSDVVRKALEKEVTP